MKATAAMICSAALTLPVGAAVCATFAHIHDQPPSVIVSYADLDLNGASHD